MDLPLLERCDQVRVGVIRATHEIVSHYDGGVCEHRLERDATVCRAEDVCLDPVPLVPEVNDVSWLEGAAPIFGKLELSNESDAGGGCSRRNAPESPARTVGVGHAPLAVDEVDNITDLHFFGQIEMVYTRALPYSGANRKRQYINRCTSMINANMTRLENRTRSPENRTRS